MCVLDAKWKALDGPPPAADVHQALAYATGPRLPGRAARLPRPSRGGVAVRPDGKRNETLTVHTLRVVGPREKCDPSALGTWAGRLVRIVSDNAGRSHCARGFGSLTVTILDIVINWQALKEMISTLPECRPLADRFGSFHVTSFIHLSSSATFALSCRRLSSKSAARLRPVPDPQAVEVPADVPGLSTTASRVLWSNSSPGFGILRPAGPSP